MFNPMVCDYFSGMVVSVPIQTRTLDKKVTPSEVHEMFLKHYDGANFVKVQPLGGEGVLADGFLASNTLSGYNGMQILVTMTKYCYALALITLEKVLLVLLFNA